MKRTIKYLIILIGITANAQLQQETTNYSYDNLNRLVQVVFHNGIVYEYQYDNLGNRLGKTIEVELPQDNYDINTVGLSCINSNDGIINIEVDRKNSYNVEIRKPIPGAEILSFTIKASNDWKLEAQNFEGERYLITITIDGISNDIYEKIFYVELDEPEPLEATNRVASDGNGFTVEMTTGTAPFTIKLNNEIIGTTNASEYSFDAHHGDIVEVSTAKACEGKYKETLSMLDAIVLHPNPTDDMVYFSIPTMEDNTALDIQISDSNGRLIETFNSSISNRQIEISIQHLSIGVYFAKFPTLGETTFKIIKE